MANERELGFREDYVLPDEGTWRRFEGRYQATPRRWLVRKLIRKIRRGGSSLGLPGQGKGVISLMLVIDAGPPA